LVKLWRIFI